MPFPAFDKIQERYRLSANEWAVDQPRTESFEEARDLAIRSLKGSGLNQDEMVQHGYYRTLSLYVGNPGEINPSNFSKKLLRYRLFGLGHATREWYFLERDIEYSISQFLLER